MHAWYLDDPSHPVPPERLAAEGILHWALPTTEAEWAAPLQAIRDARGYVQMDQVHLGPTTPNLDGLCQKFWEEHLHTDEEIRFVVAGAGVFDLRDTADRWMRVHVAAGDLIVVPKDKYHRFALDDAGTITCKRLFKDMGGWTPVPRATQTAA
ncbi:MAG: cupin domain-containing protein [Myxococcales bacterium]|nr:cupin domain-containing protein [Myxococcales bacterium]